MTSSSKLSFVFCHGWGFSPHFWHPLQTCFGDIDCHFINLGYDNAQDFEAPQLLSSDITYIGVGHSLGLTKLLKLPLKYRALIGLQSFINFLGFNSDLCIRRRRAWDIMCQNFQIYPQKTLNHFYQTCFDSRQDQHRSDLNLTLPRFKILNQDLKGLSDSHPLPCDIPLLILGTTHDKIVPPALIYDNFASIKNVHLDFYPTDGHCLGYDHSIIVAEKIIDFVNNYS
ncbi:MAG: hypothetical protein ACRYGR_04125 [Janthinobacterium lividum]